MAVSMAFTIHIRHNTLKRIKMPENISNSNYMQTQTNEEKPNTKHIYVKAAKSRII